MSTHPIPRTVTGLSMILAPLVGLGAVAALPALRDSRRAEITVIAAHPDRFYLYAVGILLSSYLLVPAYFGLMTLMRDRSPRWAYLAGGLAQIGLLVAIGDAATELLYWQMGAPKADPGQMSALANRYESAAGSGLVYSIGGLAVLAGTVLVSVGLWRTRVVPRWTTVAISVSVLANVAGFSMANQALLIGSYLLLLPAFARIGAIVLTSAPERGIVGAGVTSPTGAPAV
ncbi:MAG: DUF4386 family protein [Nocardioidaceae bacterium]